MDHDLLDSRHFVVAGVSATDVKAARQQQMPSERTLKAAMSYKLRLSVAQSGGARIVLARLHLAFG